MSRIEDIQPWESLMKRIVWRQLGNIAGKRILDFGSGLGITSDYYAKDNEVIAVEPSIERIQNRWKQNQYLQLCGSTELLRNMESESFDVILCHNVFEYAVGRAEILQEFSRLLKPEGFLSLVKHNRPGRVMQMVVLLNDFERANSLLDGNEGVT